MTKTKEFILDADTGQYLDDDGNTTAEVVGDGTIHDVTFIGDRKQVEYEEEEDDEEREEKYEETDEGTYRCLICGEEPAESKRGINSHISQVH